MPLHNRLMIEALPNGGYLVMTEAVEVNTRHRALHAAHDIDISLGFIKAMISPTPREVSEQAQALARASEAGASS